jgi:hypothetical protein
VPLVGAAGVAVAFVGVVGLGLGLMLGLVEGAALAALVGGAAMFCGLGDAGAPVVAFVGTGSCLLAAEGEEDALVAAAVVALGAAAVFVCTDAPEVAVEVAAVEAAAVAAVVPTGFAGAAVVFVVG